MVTDWEAAVRPVNSAKSTTSRCTGKLTCTCGGWGCCGHAGISATSEAARWWRAWLANVAMAATKTAPINDLNGFMVLSHSDYFLATERTGADAPFELRDTAMLWQSGIALRKLGRNRVVELHIRPGFFR